MSKQSKANTNQLDEANINQLETQSKDAKRKVWSKPTYDILKTSDTAGGPSPLLGESSTSKPAS